MCGRDRERDLYANIINNERDVMTKTVIETADVMEKILETEVSEQLRHNGVIIMNKYISEHNNHKNYTIRYNISTNDQNCYY